MFQAGVKGTSVNPDIDTESDSDLHTESTFLNMSK